MSQPKLALLAKEIAQRTEEKGCELACTVHAHTYAYMHASKDFETNAGSLRAQRCTLPPIIVQMLIMAENAIFHALLRGHLACSNAEATIPRVAAPLKRTCSCSWQ
jgi:hypothetical protein